MIKYLPLDVRWSPECLRYLHVTHCLHDDGVTEQSMDAVNTALSGVYSSINRSGYGTV